MAKATVTCRCNTCGQEFIHTKTCRNRRDAEDYEHWAQWHITQCPDCYAAEMRHNEEEKMKKAMSELSDFDLPEIVGVSDKQIAYAEKLRRKTLVDNISIAYIIIDIIQDIDDEKMSELCILREKTREEIIMEEMKDMHFDKVYMALHSNSAKEIIEALK